MINKNKLLQLISYSFLLASMATGFAQTAPTSPTVPIDEPSDLSVGTITNNTLPVTTIDEAVLFYNPNTTGPSITLSASLNDGNGNDFDEYSWYNMTYSSVTSSESENLISGETSQTLTRSSLAPGYHKFRVYGIVNDGISCPSDEFEDIILFVLPEINLEAEHLLSGNASLTYCEDEVLSGSDTIDLSVTSTNSDYSTNSNGYTNPDGSDFEFSYQWYYIKDGDTANPTTMGTNDTQNVNISNPGSYNFYVELEYTIKDKESRDYVTYTGEVEDNTGNAIEIVVTPIPGTPSISITTAND